MFVYLIGIIVFLCIVHILFNYNKRARLVRKIPGPKDDFIFGNGLTVIRSPVEIMKMGRTLSNAFKGIFRVWVYPMGAVFIYNPEDIEIIMSGMKYGEKSFVYKFLKPWLRDGLLVSNGSKWQERRKILTPAFHFNILKQFCEIIEENSHRFLDSLKETAGKPIDIIPVLSEFTLNSICETAMGTQLGDDNSGAAKSYKKAIYDIGQVFFERFVRIYLYVDFIHNLTSLGRLQTKYLKIVHNFTEKVIQQRREYIDKYGPYLNEELEVDQDDSYVYKKKKKTAMLDLLLSAEKEGLIDKLGVQEEVDTFMFEGHDTTAAGLTFCFMLIANHKDIQDKIVQELDDIFGDSDRPIKMEDLSKMKYLECCIKESLRMYPPVHFISRNLNEDTVLSKYTVPAGTFCHILILDLHYRPDLFKNPHQFDPDRFLPENSVGRHPYAYIPFSAGPRNCIGQKFAMIEMKIAVANVLRNFVLEPVTRPADIRFVADLILRNDGPVIVNFKERQKTAAP
uniref:cytochrome P450 CYP4M10 n=1 Tax=Helicoverpa armigera TaxID=29058 RepID=UPI0039E8C354